MITRFYGSATPQPRPQIRAEVLEAYREEFRKIGPRHRNVDRWEHDLGWRIDPAVADAYLKLDYQ